MLIRATSSFNTTVYGRLDQFCVEEHVMDCIGSLALARARCRVRAYEPVRKERVTWAHRILDLCNVDDTGLRLVVLPAIVLHDTVWQGYCVLVGAEHLILQVIKVES